MKLHNVSRSVLAGFSLGLVACAAQAALEPFSFSAQESLMHETNVYRSADTDREADWISITEFQAALDQALGRDRLTGSATFDIDRYAKLHGSDSTGYDLRGTFDWSLPGDLSGSLGGDIHRSQYFYGLNGETPTSSAHNLETDKNVFANFALGGVSRWTLSGGVDATERSYSDPAFADNEERQWSAHGGTSYATSPDLSFGLVGSYVKGRYPGLLIAGSQDEFTLKSLDLTTDWQAGGSSKLKASVGYSTQTNIAQPAINFVNGSLSWTWTPPSHFTTTVALSRDSNANTAAAGTALDLTGHSINDSASVAVNYLLTAKTTLGMSGQYVERRYSDATLVVATLSSAAVTASGANRTWQVSLNANYNPTRLSTIGCSLTREVRTSDASIILITPAYTDTSASCRAQIRFE